MILFRACRFMDGWSLTVLGFRTAWEPGRLSFGSVNQPWLTIVFFEEN